ncbi:MAG TPA: hypothetical protein VGM59_15650 [Dongiaceae bacterium]
MAGLSSSDSINRENDEKVDFRGGLCRRVVFHGGAFFRNTDHAGEFDTDLSFTGTVTAIDDTTGASGYHVNDKIGGILTFGPLTGSPTTASATITHWAGNSSFDFSPISASGQTTLDTENIGGLGYFGFFFEAPSVFDPGTGKNFIPSQLLIDYTVDGSSAVPLQSLKDFPTDEAGILAYLGGTLLSHNAGLAGGTDAAHKFSLTFNVDSLNLSVASTPIPATFPLFVSALGGIGFIGWWRKRSANV